MTDRSAARHLQPTARVRLLLLIVFMVGLSLSSEALGVPLITNSLVYIDNRTVSDPFGHAGLTLHAELVVTDPGGTPALTGPGAGARATATNVNFPFAQPFPLFFNAPAPIAGGADFINFLPVTTADFPNLVGSYTLGVRNTALETATVTNVLLKPEVLQFPTNLVASDHSTTPTISWTDPNPLLPGLGRLYQIQLIDDSLTIFFTGTPGRTPSIAVPPGLLTPGRQYLVRANIFDVDLSQPNRLAPNPRVALSRDYLTFTPIPEADSLLLVATGLFTLVVFAHWRSHMRVLLLFVTGLALVATTALAQEQLSDLKPLVGTWRGTVTFASPRATPPSAPVDLTITDDGVCTALVSLRQPVTVTGTLEIVDGKARYKGSDGAMGTFMLYVDATGKRVLKTARDDGARTAEYEQLK